MEEVKTTEFWLNERSMINQGESVGQDHEEFFRLIVNTVPMPSSS